MLLRFNHDLVLIRVHLLFGRLRRYAVPTSLTCAGLIGLWSAYTLLTLHVVYAAIPVGALASAIAAAASIFMLILAAWLVIKRRGFLTISPFAILAVYLSIPAALFLAAACIAFYIIRSSVNSLTF